MTPITFPSFVVGIAAYLGLLQLGLIGAKVGIVLTHSIGAVGYVVVIVSATWRISIGGLSRRRRACGQGRSRPSRRYRCR
ncbi:hypothetical protein ACVIHH_008458 [Bradyrhizobium sp. USDA 4518]